MTSSEHSIVINRPIDVVFYNTTCMRGCVKWMTSIQDAEKLSDEPVQVGTRYRHGYKFMNQMGEAFVHVTVYNPPREFAIYDSALPVEFHYTFEEVPEGTRVNVRMSMSPADQDNLSGEVIAAAVARQFDVSLNTLKTLLEADVVVREE